MDEHNRHDRSVDERRRDDRRLWRNAYLVAVLFHLVLLFMWQSPRYHESPFSAAGPRNGDPRAAAGGMQAVTMVVPPTRPITPPPIPLPSMDVEPVEFSEETPQLEVASIEGQRPGVEGPGRETGDGQGDGGTADEGLFRMIPAVPRAMIVPPDDDDLNGKRIEVWLFVDERGRVIADSTYLRPSTGKGSLDRRLMEEAAEWQFRPARRGDVAIAGWTTYVVERGGSPDAARPRVAPR